jgi:hypothetical protein
LDVASELPVAALPPATARRRLEVTPLPPDRLQTPTTVRLKSNGHHLSKPPGQRQHTSQLGLHPAIFLKIPCLFSQIASRSFHHKEPLQVGPDFLWLSP